MKLLLLLICTVVTFCVPTSRRFDNEKVFQVTPKNENEVDFIKHLDKKMKLDFWKPKSSRHVKLRTSVHFRANAKQSKTIVDLFEEKQIKYKVIFHDLQEVIENQFNKGGKNQKVFTRYYEWKEIALWMYSLSLKNPKLASFELIGETYEGRGIPVLKIGKRQTAKKGVFLECGVHAREWISPAFCQWFVNEALRTYGKDKAMTKLLDSLTFHVLPVFNIDGYIWSWTSDRMWRKNRAPTSNNECCGTDLNRNFNVSWGGIEFDDEPCSEGYAGSAPESAPETKAVTAYIREHLSSLQAYISVHAFSQLLLYPYGYTYNLPPNHEKLEQIAKSAVKSLYSLYNTNYTYGPIATTIYPASGTSIDWTYDEGIKYSFAFELRDEGQYGFLLPEHDIEPTCRETMLAIKQIANNLIDLDT